MFSFRTTPIEDQLDRSLREGAVGVVCTQASWNASSGRYLHEFFAQRGNLSKVFMPESGHIAFTADELEGLDAVVVEVQDIGVRYFNYATDVLRLVATLNSLEHSPSLYIVDHPNPAGRDVEGTLPAGDTDMWTPKVAHRHGLTLGELVNLYCGELGASFPLHVISAGASGPGRSLMPWIIPPSDDVPGMFTPFVYSGGGLWQDTTVTPGIGTLRPYEFFGAPFIKADADEKMPQARGAMLRPCSFIPSFGMYEGQVCYGYQTILTPDARYHSLLHTVRIMRHFRERYSQFEISDSLYTRLADPVMKEYLLGNITFDIVDEHVKNEEQKWIRKAKRYLLYEDQPSRIK